MDNNNPATLLLQSALDMVNNLTLDMDNKTLDTDNNPATLLQLLPDTDNNLTLDMVNNNLATLLLQ